MPIRPLPIAYTCPACGWSKTVTPKSDALMPSEVFDTCPSCSHTPLENQVKNTVPSWQTVLRVLIKSKWFLLKSFPILYTM